MKSITQRGGINSGAATPNIDQRESNSGFAKKIISDTHRRIADSSQATRSSLRKYRLKLLSCFDNKGELVSEQNP